MAASLTGSVPTAVVKTHRLARHTAFNLIGLGTPLVVAVVSIPILLSALGVPRFGMLTLIWAVVSYFGLLDLGLGRALTLTMVRTLAEVPPGDPGPATGTALRLMSLIGVVAGLAMALLAPLCVSLVEGVPDSDEAVRALWAMSLAVPAVVVASGLRAILEARNAFGWVNAIRTPLGIYTFAAPVAVVFAWGPRLDLISVALMLGRYIALAAHLGAASRFMAGRSIPFAWHAHTVRPLLTVGGWLTVGNLVGPLMGYADRFIIAAAVSASAVAFYATPMELVTKLWILPSAMTMVLFPAFAAAAARGGDEARRLATAGGRWVFAALLPVTLAMALFASEALTLWIGAAFAVESAPLLRVMAVGIMINCMAHVPLTLLQGSGQLRGPAVLQLVQVVPYIGVLWWACQSFGAMGAAIVWSARMALDTSAMFYLSGGRGRKVSLQVDASRTMFAVLVAAVAFAVAFVDLAPAYRICIWIVASLLVATVLRPWQGTAPVSAARH